MKKGLLAIGALAACVSVAGCSSSLYEPKPQMMPLKSDNVLSYPPSISHTFIYTRKNDWITCTTPAPDATFTQAEEGDVSFSLVTIGGGNDKGGAEAENSGEDEMAGRSPAVLLTRELFFRLCEFSRNYQLEKNEAIELYKSTLQTVTDGWKTEAANSKVNINSTINTNQGVPQGNLPSIPNLPAATRSTTGTTGSSTTTTSTSQ